MTAIIRYPGTGWDPTLPKLPKIPLVFPIAPTHDWDATRIAQDIGSSVTSWVDSVSGLAFTNPVGGILNESGDSKFIQFSGVSGSLSATLPDTEMVTVVMYSKPMPGDVVSGTGPLYTRGGVSVLQADADTAKASAPDSATLTATRGQWHAYSSVVPAAGAGLFGVDQNTTAFTATTRTASNLQLSVGGANRRQSRVARVLTFSQALTAAQVKEVASLLDDYYSDMT